MVNSTVVLIRVIVLIMATMQSPVQAHRYSRCCKDDRETNPHAPVADGPAAAVLFDSRGLRYDDGCVAAAAGKPAATLRPSDTTSIACFCWPSSPLMLAQLAHPTAPTANFRQRLIQQQPLLAKRFKASLVLRSRVASPAGRRALVVAAMADLAEFEKTKGRCFIGQGL